MKGMRSPSSIQDSAPKSEDGEDGAPRKIYAAYDYLPVSRGLPYVLSVTPYTYMGLKIGDSEEGDPSRTLSIR
jgi:hypothetical protein